jgi:hypothetical protein
MERDRNDYRSPKDIIEISHQKPYIKMEIDENYKDFNDFYQNNKESIYKNIIDLFKGLTRTRKRYLKLLVHSKIEGFTWGTEFVFDKGQKQILMNDILPYFEEREEYEICAEIVKVYNSIDKKKSKIL